MVRVEDPRSVTLAAYRRFGQVRWTENEVNSTANESKNDAREELGFRDLFELANGSNFRTSLGYLFQQSALFWEKNHNELWEDFVPATVVLSVR